jgi:UDP-glucose 4-epimerase
MNFHKVLVTGGAGFIGSHVVEALLARGAGVVVYDNFCRGREEFLPMDAGPALKVVRGDTRDLPALQSAMAGCDAVFHFQANIDVRGGCADTRSALEQNTVTTWNVLEAMRLNGIRSIVFSSSATIYGEPDVFPTPESHAPLQTSLYGASKYAGEAMIEAFCEYFGMRCFIYRFVSWIGERYSHGVVFDLMQKLRCNSTRLPVLGDGSQRKSYLYVKDGVEGILLGVEKASGQKNIFNLGHDTFLTVSEVVGVILDELGLANVVLEYAGGIRGWLGDSPLVHLDTGRLKALGWRPQTSMEEGLRRTVRYLHKHPHLLDDLN